MTSPGPDHHNEKLSYLSASGTDRTLNTRYSSIVRWLRLILPLTAIAIIAALFTWIKLDDNQVIIEQTIMPEEQTARNELVNPHFESRDEKNQPYTITALKATQDENDERLVILEKPSGEMTLNNGNHVKLIAEKGFYHQEKETLKLGSGVTLNYIEPADRYEMKTAAVDIDLKASTAKSDSPVQGQGPLGTIKAKGFESKNNAGLLIFKGPASLTVNKEAL